MKEQLKPIPRDEFVEYLEAKLLAAQQELDFLEDVKQSVIDAEKGGKIVRFFIDPETQTATYEIKSKPPLGFK